MRIVLPALALTAALAACSKSTPETQPEPEMVGARIATNIEAPIARGDCQEAMRRAAANPMLDVEKVAAPIAMAPPLVDTRKMPKSVPDRNGWYTVKFRVLVDTAGKADMKTFAIDTASHAWLGSSARTAVAKWKFRPAEVAGCKVPRMFSLGLTPRGKSPASAKAAPKPAAKKPAAARKPPV